MTRSEKLVTILIGAIFVLASTFASGQHSPNATPGTHHVSSFAIASTAPRTPAEMPPQPPKVTCDGGNLTIAAQNSTVAAVLNAIRACTSAEIVVSEDAAGERVFAEFGPGPVRAVLTEFFSSMDFNYVVAASPSDAQRVQTVLLGPRLDDSPTTVASNSTQSSNWRAWLEGQQNHGRSVSHRHAESSEVADAASSAPVETALVPASMIPFKETPVNLAPRAFAPAPPAASAIALASTQFRPRLNRGNSTQEMIAEMVQLFDQRKQMALLQTPTVQ